MRKNAYCSFCTTKCTILRKMENSALIYSLPENSSTQLKPIELQDDEGTDQ